VRVSGIVREGFEVCNYDYDGNETLGGQNSHQWSAAMEELALI
jgi:hypothetical protein